MLLYFLVLFILGEPRKEDNGTKNEKQKGKLIFQIFKE